jgi:putative ABC transport system permease protein
MPPDFENVLDPDAELWAPLQYDRSQGRAWGHHLRTVGRLKPGVTIDQASRELDAVGRQALRELRPETYGDNVTFAATSLHDDLTRAVRPAILTVFGAVILVLMIACVNVTNLLLARGVNRHGEFALRAALGAGRARLVQQVFTENLLLAAIGGGAGLAVAVAGVRALVALSPPDLPRAGAIAVDGTLFTAGFGVTVFIGLACGLIPAIQAARSEAHSSFRLGSPRVAGQHRRTRNALVTIEVALAVVLLIASGLLLRSLDRLFAVDAGFDSSHLLTMQVQASTARFNDAAAMHGFFQHALDRVKGLSGITAAAMTSQLPISGDADEYGVRFESSSSVGYNTFRYAVSPGYIETMKIPIRRGRTLEESDRAGAPPVALISESLANRRFRGSQALGQRLRIGPTDGPLYTVVGVVADVKQLSLAGDQADAVYVPASQWPSGDRVMSLVVRIRGDPAGFAPAVREAIWSVDRQQPVVRVATMEGLLAASAAQRRFALVLFEAFALAALVLAAAGIYGVLAGNVAERTREIGVRAALGATRGRIVSLVVGQGMMLTALGVAIGLTAAAIASGGIVSLLFGVSRLDPVTYVGVVALLGAVALVACAAPAWRALRVDPATSLRAE